MTDEWPPPADYAGTPSASNEPSPNSNLMHYGMVGGLVALIAGLVAAGLFFFVAGDDDPEVAVALSAVEAPVAPPVFEPAGSEGDDPFFPIAVQLAGFEQETGEMPTEEQVATGLFGGTAENTCDPQRLIDFLLANPVKGAAWADVQGITFAEIPEYIESLDIRVLATETTVLNHGYDEESGAAYEIESTLEAGTAVLVDADGVIRTRCYCGNPIKPKPIGHRPPRCLFAPAQVYATPALGDEVAGVPNQVTLTGRITEDEAWTEITWGDTTSHSGWTPSDNVRRTLCTSEPPPATTVGALVTPTTVAQTPTTSPTATTAPTPTTGATATTAPTPSTAPTATTAPTPTATPPVLPQPLQISCTIAKRQLTVGEQTELSAVHVPDSVSIDYAFEHGDGTIDRRNPSFAFYETPGSYDVYVIATIENLDRRELCGTITVSADGPDTVQFFCSISDTRVVVGGPTTFTASSDPGELPVTYVFDHGDGFREQANPSYAAYAQPGSYPVTLEYTYQGSTGTLACGTVTVDADTTPVTCSDQGYVGLLLEDAKSLATSRGCAWRIVGEPGDTQYRPDRVNFQVGHGQIQGVTIG